MVIQLRRSTGSSVIVLALILAGCGGAGVSPSSAAGPTAAGPTAPGPRPSSPATLEIVEPVSGSTVTGTSVHIVLKLTGARIVATTSTAIQPDEGHVHLYVDNNLVSMNYSLEQDLEVHPGTYVLRAEFVASDHAPFNPRVWSDQVFFTVK